MRIILFFILFGFSFNCFSQNADIELLRNINLNRNKNLDAGFQFISNTTGIVSFGIPTVVLGTGLIMNDSTIKHKGLLLGTSLILTSGITVLMKYSINRERPFKTYPDIEKLSSAGSKSFPSGHTSEAFSTATSLSLAFPKWYVIAPSYLWASSVGYSRMHLGVHYPSDVAVGALVGAGSAFLCYSNIFRIILKIYFS
jgi:membrane-associated phospholipid phosphatase